MESASYIFVEGKQENMADWTLKRRGGRRKSKRNEKKWWIGLRRGERHGCMLKSGKLSCEEIAEFAELSVDEIKSLKCSE